MWFIAQLVSASGTMTQTVAMAWIVLQITHSAADLGWLTTLTLGPVLVFGGVFGATSDDVDRRTLLILTQSAFIVVSLILSILAMLRFLRIDALYALAGATGVVTAFDGPARQVYVRDVVGEVRVASAVSLYEVILNLSRIAGPMIGGTFLAVWGPAWCFLFNASTYVLPLSVLLITRAKDGRRRKTTADRRRRKTTAPARSRTGVLGGIRIAAQDPAIRYCLLMAAVSGTVFNTSLFFPVLADRAFDAGAEGYAALLACFGLGALPGAIAASSGGRVPNMRQVSSLGWMTGALVVVTALVPRLIECCCVVALTGFVSIWFITAANTLVQLRSPVGARGRVMGLWTMALPGTNPISAVLFGLMADWLGAREAYSVAGALLVLSGLLGFLRGQASGASLGSTAVTRRPAE